MPALVYGRKKITNDQRDQQISTHTHTHNTYGHLIDVAGEYTKLLTITDGPMTSDRM